MLAHSYFLEIIILYSQHFLVVFHNPQKKYFLQVYTLCCLEHVSSPSFIQYLKKKKKNHFKCLQQRELNAGTLVTHEVEELMPTGDRDQQQQVGIHYLHQFIETEGRGMFLKPGYQFTWQKRIHGMPIWEEPKARWRCNPCEFSPLWQRSGRELLCFLSFSLCQLQIGTCHGHLPATSTEMKLCTAAAADF